MASKICSKCGAKIPGDAEFCPVCGKQNLNKCPKCGAKLTKTDKFCIKCGFKLGESKESGIRLKELKKGRTYSGSSFGSGIASLFLGWIPIFGWIFILIAIIYGITALRKINEGDTTENRGKAVSGIILGLVSLLINIFVLIGFLASVSK